MFNPLISVIIPVYNVKTYLRECIDSVFAQTYTNIEIILIDDGSSDGSSYICDEYSKLDNRVIVVHQENGGLSSARNAGIQIAQGSYLTFIDSDDYIHIDMLSILLDEIIKYKADIACCSYSSYELQNIKEREDVLLKKEEAISRLLDENGYKCYAWNKLYKRELFEEIRYPIGKWFEDIITTYKLFSKSQSVVYTNQKLYFYRLRKDSITQSAFSQKDGELLEAINFVIKDADWLDVMYKKRLVAGYIYYYVHYVKKGVIAKADIKDDIYSLKRYIFSNWSLIITNSRISFKFKMELVLLVIAPKIFGQLLRIKNLKGEK